MTPGRGQRFAVVAFCLALAALVVRTHVVSDDRWGFSMFRDVWVYQATYTWVLADGSRLRYDTSKDLRGDARQIGATRGRDHILGLGALHAMVRGFGDWAWENRRPEEAVALEVNIDRRYYGEGRPVQDRFRWP